MKELFDKLPDGKKALLLRKYISMFGGRSTFYNKIAGTVKVRPAEQMFFNNHLNQQNESTASQRLVG